MPYADLQRALLISSGSADFGNGDVDLRQIQSSQPLKLSRHCYFQAAASKPTGSSGGHIASTNQAASSAVRKPSAQICTCPAGVAVETRTHPLALLPSFSFCTSARSVLVRFTWCGLVQL